MVRPIVLVFSALLPSACGAITPALPTAASPVAFAASSPAAPAPAPAPAAAQAYPSLTGRWRAAGTEVVYRNIAAGTTPGDYNCQGLMTIEQQGGTFTGSFSTQGSGFNSDRFCTGSGTLRGEIMAADGSQARASLDGGFGVNQCTFVSGGGAFTGSAREDGISLQRVDIYRCPVNLDGGPGMPLAEFERTITLSFERW